MPVDLPNIVPGAFRTPDLAKLQAPALTHKPRILLLYGSLRERSFSRFATEEAARLLQAFGAETRIFDPRDLPLEDSAPVSHHKVAELRGLSSWSEGQVWCSPERHGAMTGIMKTQIDWIPLSIGAVRPTQGKTLAVMQGQRRIAVVQRSQPAPCARPLDADDHDSEPVIGRESL